ncbi:MAG: HAMP domain-containing protein [Solirubrobacterales bacterium]|nr:HAMP domain-containing protein [Solirubrobacterales bacterium]
MTLRIRLLAALAYVLLLAVIALGVPLAINLSARVKAEVRTQARAQADLVAATSADLLQRPSLALSRLARKAAVSVRGRVIIVNSRGTILVDSAGPRELGASYLSRPEIAAALRGRQVQFERNSRTLGQPILATAAPIIRNGRPIGAVRVTQSTAAVDSAVRQGQLGLGLIGAIVLALGLFAGAIIAEQVARPLRRLECVARRVAQGDLRARARVEGSREQRSLAASFNEMTDRIARLVAAQRGFVADASHQLRTPLTGLRLRLEEAKVLTDSPASEGEIDAAVGEVDRLTRTVDELLVLSRAGERQLTGSRLDLRELAASAVERWRAPAAARGISLQHRRTEAESPVWAARADVERVLDILLENAVGYSPVGGRVTVVSAPSRLEVHDRGPGVAADEREAVFDRFRRGRAGTAGPPGSGLGLAIARELARGWGGDVTLEDRPGGGAVAIVSLPQHRDPTQGLPAINPTIGTLP